MTGPLVIELAGVSKRYVLGGRGPSGGSLRDSVAALFHRRAASPAGEVWALREVDLRVGAGERVGVIGRNGAGKSTLLKVISRIAEPTAGVCRTRGRVGSLLEVGTGFHPELTGRENVFLNGSILGMRRRTIAERFDEIVGFAEVEHFIDTPVKRYSSGMELRLAFAVAAHLDADIVLLDEVLAVGDAEFQRRCLEVMSRMGSSGRTVIFASHDLGAVSRLCERTVWLDGGGVAGLGPTADIVELYLGSGADGETEKSFAPSPGVEAGLTHIRLRDTNGMARSVFSLREQIVVTLGFAVAERSTGLDLAVTVHTLTGVCVLDETWSDVGGGATLEAGTYEARAVVPSVLNRGTYRVGVWIGARGAEYASVADALTFHVEGPDLGRPARMVRLGLNWHVEAVQGADFA